MRIIISPARKMKENDALPWRDLPVFTEEAERIKSGLRTGNQ